MPTIPKAISRRFGLRSTNIIAFFEHKNVDWQAIGEQYRQKIADGMTDEELFRVCADMLAELKDGHTNLSSPFDVSRYWIWEQYPQNYDERLIQNIISISTTTAPAASTTAYCPTTWHTCTMPPFHPPSEKAISTTSFRRWQALSGLIVDVRDNGGGIITNAETLVARFIDHRILAGYISHKTGPGHNEFSEPYAYYIEPAQGAYAGTNRWSCCATVPHTAQPTILFPS